MTTSGCLHPVTGMSPSKREPPCMSGVARMFLVGEIFQGLLSSYPQTGNSRSEGKAGHVQKMLQCQDLIQPIPGSGPRGYITPAQNNQSEFIVALWTPSRFSAQVVTISTSTLGTDVNRRSTRDPPYSTTATIGRDQISPPTEARA
ncbi:unnamed protein product [Penicillium camemberti]|uniref:Str. FM013 n=1 Tax=Penicillium camemberti (strain FM 013) TaxID=1429867 RepID=A0A0G4PBF0_PENC3|nr:unnamed protein product [Penicillium camemberti]